MTRKVTMDNRQQSAPYLPFERIDNSKKKEAYVTPPLSVEPPKTASTSLKFLNPSEVHIPHTQSISCSDFKQSDLWKTDEEFMIILKDVEKAIKADILPERIHQGSSGSYFVKNTQGTIVGVFKPWDEEPYSEFNPKWVKLLHRTCCPCLFGRGCLMPNVGYISETAASMIDRHFGLGIVPRTEIVNLTSPSFNHGWFTSEPKTKIGSFQLYVNGLLPSQETVKLLSIAQTRYPHVAFALQLEFEKLVVLDYLIRNTDRSWDNWLLCVEWRDVETNSILSTYPLPPADLPETAKPNIKVIGIDHGLAFPWKHPDQWRSYPYSWIDLELAQTPFSEHLKAHLLPILRDASNWDLLIDTLLSPIFKQENTFSDRLFRRQMSVLRGQMRNLLVALEAGYSPYQLVKQLPDIRLEADDEMFAHRYGARLDRGGFEMDAFFTDPERRMWRKKVQARPCFSFF